MVVHSRLAVALGKERSQPLYLLIRQTLTGAGSPSVMHGALVVVISVLIKRSE